MMCSPWWGTQRTPGTQYGERASFLTSGQPCLWVSARIVIFLRLAVSASRETCGNYIALVIDGPPSLDADKRPCSKLHVCGCSEDGWCLPCTQRSSWLKSALENEGYRSFQPKNFHSSHFGLNKLFLFQEFSTSRHKRWWFFGKIPKLIPSMLLSISHSDGKENRWHVQNAENK